MGILRRPFHRLAGTLIVALAGTTACAAPSDSGAAPPPADASAAVTAAPSSASSLRALTDDAGREVTLDATPERVVSLAPSNSEIVCALDACDLLVGVTDYDDFPAEVTELPEIVVQTQVDLERLVAAEPDLVLAAGNELTPTSVIAQIEDLGIPVLVLYPESLDEIYADIELVGDALDRAEEADAVVDDFRARVAEVEAAVQGADRPITLYEVFHAEGTTYTAGEGSFLASLLEIAAAQPVTGDAEGVLEAEELAAADPQLILLGTASYDPALATPEAALAAVRARPGWADLTAVRENRVVPYLADIVTTRPGPRIVEGLEALARAIHPELFE
jgi:iron complex transport system substrate-binding protein